MNYLKDKTIVITGASSGIGEASAIQIAAKGAQTVLVARSEDKLKSIVEKIKKNGGKAIYKIVDVTKIEELREVATFCEKEYGKVDALVNNAGLMLFSYWKDAVIEDWNKMIEVNIKGYLNSIAAFLPKMIENNNGQILNMGSVVGIHPGEAAGVYSGTKFFVRGINESLRQEVGGKYNIKISMVCPGTIDTGWADKVNDEEGSKLAKQVNEDASITPDKIANAVVFSLDQEDGVSVNDIVVAPTQHIW